MATTTLFDIARMTTATTGTGTITLGSAVTSFLTFAQAGVTDQTVVRYVIEDSPNREVGFGTYTASGTTLTRNVTKSTNSNALISLSGNAQVALTALAEDVTNKNGDTLTGGLNWASAVTVTAAATTTIGAQSSNYIIVNGTNAISNFDTIAQGSERILRFAGSLVLVNSSSLICVGNASVTTSVGDVARFISEGSGVWRMIDYQSAGALNAPAIAPAVSILTSSQTVTIPAGATKCEVTLVGGGGGGGGAVGSTACCVSVSGVGGPGGCAGVLVKYLASLVPGNTLSLTIGAAGSAGGSNGAGGAGGSTVLSSGTQTITTLTASGGGGGAAGPPGTKGVPGTGTNGDLNFTAQTSISGGTGYASTGLGFGSLPLGPTSATPNTAGNAGLNYGGGGSGGVSPAGSGTIGGGAGAAGLAILKWYP